jgi:hypothetical protein
MGELFFLFKGKLGTAIVQKCFKAWGTPLMCDVMFILVRLSIKWELCFRWCHGFGKNQLFITQICIWSISWFTIVERVYPGLMLGLNPSSATNYVWDIGLFSAKVSRFKCYSTWKASFIVWTYRRYWTEVKLPASFLSLPPMWFSIEFVHILLSVCKVFDIFVVPDNIGDMNNWICLVTGLSSSLIYFVFHTDLSLNWARKNVQWVLFWLNFYENEWE